MQHSEKLNVAEIAKLVTSDDHLSAGLLTSVFSSILSLPDHQRDLYWGYLFGALEQMVLTPPILYSLYRGILQYDDLLAERLNNKPKISTGKPVVALTGSGKESFKTLNVSTCAAITCSVLGVSVIKPGSKSTSAVSGATDILNFAGIRICENLESIEDELRDSNIVFLDYSAIASTFAAKYDGKFHMISPLSYFLPFSALPIRVDFFLYGLASPNVKVSAELMRLLDFKAGAVVSTGEIEGGRIDEYSCCGVVDMAIWDGTSISATRTNPTRQFSEADLSYLSHRNAHDGNFELFEGVMKGVAPEGILRLVAENSALALRGAGVVRDFDEGVERAMNALRSGRVYQQYRALKGAVYA